APRQILPPHQQVVVCSAPRVSGASGAQRQILHPHQQVVVPSAPRSLRQRQPVAVVLAATLRRTETRILEALSEVNPKAHQVMQFLHYSPKRMVMSGPCTRVLPA